MAMERCKLLLSSMCLVGLAACTNADNTGPEVPVSSPSRTASNAEAKAAQARGEDLFLELEKVAPSSAGFAYEGTRLVVFLADEAERAVAEAFIARAVSDGRILPPGGGRRVESYGSRKVKYSYRTLANFRARVDSVLLGVDRDLQFIDLDEAANTVTLGYSGDTTTAVSRVRQSLSLSRADESMLRVERTGAARPDTRRVARTRGALSQVPGNLTFAATPMVGGIIIHRQLQVDYKLCTLGFTAKRNGVTGFVTNSHCTEDMYGLGGTYKTFGQPFSRIVGVETVDPNGYSCAVAPPTECRGADAAFIQSNNTVSHLVGFLAKPASRNTGELSMTSSTDYIRIKSTGTAVAGMTVEKIGAVTGWTSGGVTHTCVTAMIQEDQWFKRVACADKTLYTAQEGDSGSPVWLWLPYSPSEGGVQAGLLGIHSSREIEGNSKYFSRIDRILSDLEGSWEILGPTPPSPLQAHIWGWTDVKTSSGCQLTYSAHATGGNGSYSFSAMSTNATIVASSGNVLTLSFPTAGSYNVSFTATDGTGAQSTAYFSVQSDPSNLECYGAPPGNPF